MASRKSGKKLRSGRAAARSLRPMSDRDGSKGQRPSTVADLFGGGDTGHLLQGRFQTEAVYQWFQGRHAKGRLLVDEEGYYRNNDHEWKVPYGLRQAINAPLQRPHIVNQYPFFVTWVSPKTGKRLRKYFGSIPRAMTFVAEKAQYVDSDAAVVSRHGYDIPPKLRGKFPRKMGGFTHYWCCRCMAPRRFRRVYERGRAQTFFAIKKEWNEEKGRYDFKDRELALLECTVCGGTNREHKFRRSNQPWEIRRFKKGVRRARPRKRRKK